LDYKTIFKDKVLRFVGKLTDQELDWFVAGLSSDVHGFDLKPMIAAHGPRVAIEQALIHIGSEQRSEAFDISMEEYLWFKHEVFIPADERDGKFSRILDTMELALLDMDSDEALCLIAMVWTDVYIRRITLGIRETLGRHP
jgi:hypothetical protein